MLRSPRPGLGAASILAVVLAALAAGVPAQAQQRAHVGYAYPAGGQQGSTIIVRAGGQFLGGANRVYISGEGVTGRVLLYAPPRANLDGDQARKFTERMADAWIAKTGASTNWQKNLALPGWLQVAGGQEPTEEVEVPEHPLLDNLDQMTLEELVFVFRTFFWPVDPIQRQLSLEEIVRMEITIAPDAKPGERELRIQSAGGLSEPLCFKVGTAPELNEWEQNEPANMALPVPEPPFVLNGQCLPGDVDNFRFNAEQGQQLVMRVEARSLIPYLADAVPGWFQATLAVWDDSGNELAFNDDFGFEPDPVIVFSVPTTGEYHLTVNDAIYRGRDDFVYRVSVAEEPFVTSMFPLGAREGATVTARVTGWNLPVSEAALDTTAEGARVRLADTLLNGARLATPLHYAVSALPDTDETEPNNSSDSAQQVELPIVINGRVSEPGDVDTFVLQGRSGEEVVVEVLARRIGSPVDSLVQILDESGAVVAWNDDTPDSTVGLITHQADSYVATTLPADGAYTVRLSDCQEQGGSANAYRLRISPPTPDFALRIEPSSVSVRIGNAVPVTVHAIRREGFDGPIDLAIMGDPHGLYLRNARILEGNDSVIMAIGAPLTADHTAVALQLAGYSEINGMPVVRPVAPAEDMMQAFLNRHMVEVHDLLVLVP